MKQKGFAPILILVLVIIGVAGYFGYKYVKPIIPQAPHATPLVFTISSPTPDPTANWKKYVDTKNQFSFKYPVSVSITTADQGVKISGLGKDVLLTVESAKTHNFFSSKIAKTTKFGDNNWSYLTGNDKYCDGGECGTISDAFQITHLDNRYTFVLGSLGYPNTTFDQILSTFKFTNPTSDKAKECLASTTCTGSQPCMANPAAVFCKCMGGTEKIVNTSVGQAGMCVIDGKEIDEWTYFRSFSGE